MSASVIRHTRNDIMAMLDGGSRPSDVARHFGISKAAVSQAKARHNRGCAVHVYVGNERPSSSGVKDGTLKLGCGGFRQFVLALPEPVIDWLLAETPDGATVADMVRAIITDAHAEASQ